MVRCGCCDTQYSSIWHLFVLCFVLKKGGFYCLIERKKKVEDLFLVDDADRKVKKTCSFILNIPDSLSNIIIIISYKYCGVCSANEETCKYQIPSH